MLSSTKTDKPRPKRKVLRRATDPENYLEVNNERRKLLNKLRRQNMELKLSTFENINDFKNKYDVFINETHKTLLHALMRILQEVLGNEEDDDDADDDIKCEAEDTDILSMKVQKIAYEMLHDIMLASHNAMQKRKETFYEAIHQLLHTLNGNSLTFIDSYLQRNWDSFVVNRYYQPPLNAKDDDDDTKEEKKANLIHFKHENIDHIIDNIYEQIKRKRVSDTYNTYSVLFMLCKTRNHIDVHRFIAECCVLFWVMMLYKQASLKLSHHSFWIKQWEPNFTA
eukprot:144653_1